MHSLVRQESRLIFPSLLTKETILLVSYHFDEQRVFTVLALLDLVQQTREKFKPELSNQEESHQDYKLSNAVFIYQT